MSEIISTKEAALLLNITQAGVTDLLRRETLKGQKLGREWMVYKESVQEYKKVREQRAKTDNEDNKNG